MDISTRYGKNFETCIDNVFTNFDSSNSNVIDLDLSDHCGIKSKFYMNPKPSFTFGRFRSKVNPSNIDKVKSELNKINLVNFLDKVPLKNKYGVFSDVFKYIINNHMPVLKKRRNSLQNHKT